MRPGCHKNEGKALMDFVPETGNKGSWFNPDDGILYLLWKGCWLPSSEKPERNGRYDRVHVPFELSHLVCNCKESDRTLRPRLIDGKKSRYIECTHCGKYAKYLMLKCSVCNDWYLNTYRHPNKCLFERHCWDCISKTTGPICSASSFKYANHSHCEWLRKYQDFEPVAPLPVDMTRRESKPDLVEFTFDL